MQLDYIVLGLVGGDAKEKETWRRIRERRPSNFKFDLFSWVVIIMHIPRFDLVNSFLAQGIDFRMSIIMPCS